jgi:hypothetical protein
MIEDAHSPEEKQNIIGSSAQEFVDKFMNSYLKKQIRIDHSCLPFLAFRLLEFREYRLI